MHQGNQRLNPYQHLAQFQMSIEQQSDLSVGLQVLEATAQVARSGLGSSHHLRDQMQRHWHVEHPLDARASIQRTGIGMVTELLALGASSQRKILSLHPILHPSQRGFVLGGSITKCIDELLDAWEWSRCSRPHRDVYTLFYDIKA